MGLGDAGRRPCDVAVDAALDGRLAVAEHVERCAEAWVQIAPVRPVVFRRRAVRREERVARVVDGRDTRPQPVEAQAAVLWTAQNGYFDDVAVEKIKDCQNKLTEYLATRKSALTAKLAKEKALSDALTAELKAAVSEFKQTYR